MLPCAGWFSVFTWRLLLLRSRSSLSSAQRNHPRLCIATRSPAPPRCFQRKARCPGSFPGRNRRCGCPQDPREPVVAYLPSDAADLPSRVILSRGIVYVNQYTGQILGVRTRGQTFLGMVRARHVRLATGEAGRVVLKWAAVGLLFSLVSGLYLWWPVKRIRVRGTMRFYKEHKVLVRPAQRCRHLLVPALAGARSDGNYHRFRRSGCVCSAKAVGFALRSSQRATGALGTGVECDRNNTRRSGCNCAT